MTVPVAIAFSIIFTYVTIGVICYCALRNHPKYYNEAILMGTLWPVVLCGKLVDWVAVDFPEWLIHKIRGTTPQHHPHHVAQQLHPDVDLTNYHLDRFGHLVDPKGVLPPMGDMPHHPPPHGAVLQQFLDELNAFHNDVDHYDDENDDEF